MPNIDYMAQPVCVGIPAFDVLQSPYDVPITFSFTVRGGQQVLSSTLRIYANNGSTTPLYTQTVTSYLYSQTVSTQTLLTNNIVNNGEYL